MRLNLVRVRSILRLRKEKLCLTGPRYFTLVNGKHLFATSILNCTRNTRKPIRIPCLYRVPPTKKECCRDMGVLQNVGKNLCHERKIRVCVSTNILGK